MDEDERHGAARKRAQRDAEAADRGGLVADGAPHARRGGAEDAEEADLPAPLEDERGERVQDAEHGHGERDGLERVRDGEGAVEDPEDEPAERRVRPHAERVPALQRRRRRGARPPRATRRPSA